MGFVGDLILFPAVKEF